MMELKLNKIDILRQLYNQLRSHFLLSELEEESIETVFDCVLLRCEKNFQSSDNKYFKSEWGGVKFNPYHSVQYMIFLYYLSNELYKQKKSTMLCDKVYYLNKIMNGVDLLYAIELPNEFGAEHPLGTIMGRAKYGDGFFFYQGCTVGGTRDKEGNLYYPEIGNDVHMFAHSAILGRCKIGDNVQIGAGAIVKNQNIPSNSIVFGESPNLIIKQR